jgi:hypothetical protein
MDHEAAKPKQLELTSNIVRIGDVNSLVRELEAVENFFLQTKIRRPGEGVVPPRLSRSLEEFTNQNNLNVLYEDQLKTAKDYLTQLQSRAPIITISFATEAPLDFTNKLVKWLRLNIHPEVLLKIGLIPDLVAGCVVRTNNKQFDFSMRQRLKANQTILKGLITGSVETKNA